MDGIFGGDFVNHVGVANAGVGGRVRGHDLEVGAQNTYIRVVDRRDIDNKSASQTPTSIATQWSNASRFTQTQGWYVQSILPVIADIDT